MNQVLLIGRLTKDPELKYTRDGKGYCNFSLAVSREFKKDEVDFINCVAWDKRAEAIANYVKKGNKLGIIGRLQIDKNNDIFYTKIAVEKIEFLESNKNESTTSEPKKSNKVNPKPDLNLGEPKVEIEFEDDDSFPF